MSLKVKVMSPKFDIEEYPERWSKEIVSALEDYKNGKINSKRKLRKFVNREISEHYYNELIKRHATLHRRNKKEKKEELTQKIKHGFCVAVAIIVLFGSMGETLGDLLVRYGAGVAIGYFILYFVMLNWAFNDAAEPIESEKAQLKQENLELKWKLERYKNITKELEAKIEELQNNSQQE